MIWGKYNAITSVIAVCLCTQFSLTFVDPQTSAILDMRYGKGNETYMGAGSFLIPDIAVQVKFPINQQQLIVYETHLTQTNSDYYTQLFIDLDSLSLPFRTQIGRFEVPFSDEPLNAKDRFYTSDSIIRDTTYPNSTVSIWPAYETGINLYNHNKFFSFDGYLVNGNGKYSQGTTNTDGFSAGCRASLLLRDIVKSMLSIYYNDMGDTNIGDNMMMTALDNSFTFMALDFHAMLLALSGKLNNNSSDGSGIELNSELHCGYNWGVGLMYSQFILNDLLTKRYMSDLNFTLSKNLSLRFEYLLDYSSSNDQSYKFQTQLLVGI